MAKSTTTKHEASKSGTRYGVKSAPPGTQGHFFKWDGGAPGVGTGTCIHCGVKQQQRPNGVRGGKLRFYRSVGTRAWTETEPKCVRKTEAVVSKAKSAKAA